MNSAAASSKFFPRLLNQRKLVILWAIIGLIIAAALALLAWASYQNRFTINPDGVAYISIAQHYLAGNFHAAINGYWSPLLSWLMVIPLAAGFSGQTSFAVVNFFAASFILLFGSWLAYKLSGSRLAIAVYFLAVIPFLLSVLAGPITPDSLVVGWVLLFVYTLWRIDSYLEKAENLSWKNYLALAAIAGAVGSLGYVTKLFLQPVFVVAIIGFFLIRWFFRQSTGRRAAALAALTILVYGLISLAWIVPISLKYHQPMVGSSYRFNTIGNGDNLPMTRMLIPPANDQAVSSWEDPTYLIKYKDVNPPAANVNHPSRPIQIINNLPAYLDNVLGLWILIYAPFVIALVILLVNRHAWLSDKRWLWLLLVSAVYFGGYALLGVGRHRYQWPILVLSLLLAAGLLAWFWRWSNERDKDNFAWRGLAGLLVLAVVVSLYLQYPVNPRRLAEPNNPGRLQIIASQIKQNEIIPANARIAGNDFAQTTYLGYFLGDKSYGTIPPGKQLNDSTVRRQLAKFDVNYFIDFSGHSHNQAKTIYQTPALSILKI